MTDRADEHESRWGGPATVLALVLLGAAALRLAAVRQPAAGEERELVRRAWSIAHGGGLDPHPWFEHPSLLLYLLAPFESWQPEPSYVAARLVVVVLALAGIGAAWWLGASSYGVVAGGVAAVAVAVATAHVLYSRVALPDILLATLVTVALALLVADRIELAGLAAGLAAAAKYPGALLLVPLAIVAWRRWRRLGLAVALAVAGFALASPFALLHAGETWSDLRRGLARARSGGGSLAFADRLWDSLGPFLVVAALALAVALARRSRADVVLASWTLVWVAALLPLEPQLDRYVLPLVPALAVLGARFTALAPVLLLLLAVPLTWSVRDTRELRNAGPTPVVAVAQPRAAAFQLPSGP